ncbi:PilX N-terminal domain-containing pilus assembly protein [Comamonas endophytica]|nr:hypothetical protein [Acidovorax sp. D4N7]
MLAVTTILVLFAFRNSSMYERISGNTMEKGRSFQAAQSSLRFAEWWLERNNLGEISDCETRNTVESLGDLRVCSTALASGTTLPWSGSSVFTPKAMAISTDAGLNTDSSKIPGDANYYASPEFYISELGSTPGGREMLYSVSGAGFGANASSVSIVESTFAFKYRTINLGGL